MPDFRFGNRQVEAIYLGATPVTAVYFGSTQIWPSGLSIGVPVDAVVWTDFAPGVFTGVNLAIPCDSMVWTDFAPDVELGDIIPTDGMVWTDYVPIIAAGAHLEVPGDALEWADFAPIVSISATVPAPADAMEWEDYAPVVVSGAGMEFPSDETVWEDYAPLIASGVNLAIPVSLMAWHDFGVVAGYGFSPGFSSGFNALPSAAGAGVPADAMTWHDFAPMVEAKAAAICDFLGYGGMATRSGAVHTIADFDFGEGGTIIVPVHAYRFGSTNMSLASSTIGGVPAQIIASASGTVTGVRAAIYLIGAEGVPSGTGDIEITMGQSTSEIAVWGAGYRAMNLLSLVPASADNLGQTGFNASSNNSRSAIADVPEGGIFFGAATVYHDSGSETFTGVTNDYFQTTPNLHFSAGFDVAETAETDKTVTFTKSGGAESMYGGVIAVGLR